MRNLRLLGAEQLPCLAWQDMVNIWVLSGTSSETKPSQPSPLGDQYRNLILAIDSHMA